MPELLSPAGNPEKLRAALRYGADAVYLAGARFGMRAAADNFDPEQMQEAIRTAHAAGAKVYVTVNTQPRDEEYPALDAYLSLLGELSPDALIVGDLGVLSRIRKRLPRMPIHISTQANALSAATVEAWGELGAERVVLSRELSLDAIAAIKRTVPKIELEVFVHGSMCVSYSGRCLLSNYLTGRDAGRGACTQPCRWQYRVARAEAVLYEEKRPNEPIPVFEEGGESFFLSSRDLCMIEHIPALIESGISSFKIEGRIKSAYYAAVVTNAYRMAIDAAMGGKPYDPRWLTELESVSHRPYDTGYFFDSPHKEAKVCTTDGYLREKAYLATVLSYDERTGTALFLQRNKVVCGSAVELLLPGRIGIPFSIEGLQDENGEPIDAAPHPLMRFRMRVPCPVTEGDLLRGCY